MALYFLLPRSESLTTPMVAFLAVTLWALCAWALDTMNETAVGIVLPVLYVLFCGISQKVVYAPWLSEVPIIVIGGFTLGKIMQETGLSRRIALGCVKATGGSFAGALVGMTIGAVIVAPLVPSIMGKAAIFCAIAVSLCDSLDFKPKSREATAILLATCLAVASTKLAYLTGAGDLVMGMGLADAAMGTNTSWMEYAKYNFPPAIAYTALSLGIVLLVLRSSTSDTALRDVVQTKYAELGATTEEQKRALALLCLTLVLLSTDSLHHISAGIVLVLITGISFLPGVSLMTGKRLSSINFAPIFFIMGCMAIGSTGSSLKVTNWLVNQVLPVFQGSGAITASLSSYFMGVTAHFLLTPLAATSTLTTPLIELGIKLGLDPKLLYFSFQYGLDNLILPYEYALYLYFFSTGYICLKDLVLVMAIRIIVAAAFVACIAVPYWRIIS
ncbi:SLC13 family permease [Desulfovibrio desulfuricans]|uniref:SLC13 family permease n=1 Tax=Desulfovibrio desulfuricans TaxID=876 RepID=UPI0035AEE943